MCVCVCVCVCVSIPNEAGCTFVETIKKQKIYFAFFERKSACLLNVCVYVRLCIRVYMFECVYVYVRVCVCVCLCVYIYEYACIFVNQLIYKYMNIIMHMY